MRKIVEDQLNACIWADLNHYNSQTNTYSIPKYTKPQYAMNACYLVKLPVDIINNPQSILATNYNKGSYPVYLYYKIFVNKQLGKLIYVDGLAYDFENKKDLNSYWAGWLDTETLTQIATM